MKKQRDTEEEATALRRKAGEILGKKKTAAHISVGDMKNLVPLFFT
ncbi:MAG TPA: hypothetical protein VK435_07375 [Thermodesulfovibrionales bacterium]|nr:hypothetical protein [Thermodesulfovibrionales bacterium]